MTTRQILETQVLELLADNIQDQLLENVAHVLKAGAIDSEQIRPTDYRVARAIVALTLSKVSSQFKPITQEGKDEMNNLSKFI